MTVLKTKCPFAQKFNWKIYLKSLFEKGNGKTLFFPSLHLSAC
jgi:hypothetical protein